MKKRLSAALLLGASISAFATCGRPLHAEPAPIAADPNRGKSFAPLTLAEICPSVKLIPPPASLSLHPFYKKYLNLVSDPNSALGIPLSSSENVSPQAFRVASYILLRLLSVRADVRAGILKTWSTPASHNGPNMNRVAILATNEVTTNMPEYDDLTPKSTWDRCRGLGATAYRPLTSAGEENLMQYGYPTDKYYRENILVHEFAQTFWDMGMLKGTVDALQQDAQRNNAYASAMASGRWVHTYAATNPTEYWAEGIQDWFDANGQASPPYRYPDPPPFADGFDDSADGIHNLTDTRAELQTYDPLFYALAQPFFASTRWSSFCKPYHRTSARIEAEDYDPAKWWEGAPRPNYNDTASDVPANQGDAAYRNDGVDIYSERADDGPGFYVGSTRTGEWLKYSVFVANADKYVLRFRTSTPNSRARIKVYVDDILKVTVPLGNTGGWWNWAPFAASPISISAGLHVIRLQFVGSINFGSFDLGYRTASIPGTLEAEDYAAGKLGFAYNDTTSGNSGGSSYRADDVDIKDSPTRSVTNTAAGEWINYEVDVAADGNYRFNTYFANRGAVKFVHFEYSTDGVNFARLTNGIALTRTSPVASPVVHLRRGFGLIRLFYDTGGAGLDIDKFEVTTNSAMFDGSCSGAFVAGYCWYLGGFDQSCDSVCAPHGGYNVDTQAYTGASAQGGSRDNCQKVLRSLGQTASLHTSSRSDGLGLGCHRRRNGGLWWLTSPNENSASTTTDGSVQRACACYR